MKKTFINNWKMYGLNIAGFQIVPCYYDLKRFFSKLARLSYKLNIVNFSYFIYVFRSTFDTSIDIEMVEERQGGRYMDYGRGFES